MNSRNDPTNPANMSAEERVAEIATILAAGVLRLRRQAAVPAAISPPSLLSDSGRNSLEECGEESLNGHGESPNKPCAKKEKR